METKNMSDTLALLASLKTKLAIKDTKADFLATRYVAKLDLLVPEPTLLPEEGDPETVKRIKEQNDKTKQTARKVLIKTIALADPTDVQDKNDFTEWLIKQYIALEVPIRAHWAEDVPNIKQNLSKFLEIRNTPAFKEKDEAGQPKNKTDINQYKDLAELSTTIARYSSASARYTLPQLSPTGVSIIFEDGSYIMWQVTDAKDLVALSSFPANNPPAWCTKNLGTAQSYLATGPEYVAYKDGDPLFQIDPHDRSGKPQFMSRHNTKMHSSKMMNMEAATLLTKVMEGGTLNEQAKKDMDHVMDVYKAPNLDDADTFEYLKEYVLVNGSAAKKDPRFIEIEQSYVKPRFLTAPHGMEPDEIRQLTNRYGRAGEATASYVMDNKACAVIAKKIQACDSFTEFLKLNPSNGTAPPAERLSEDQFGLAYRLDGLFKLVFGLFDKEFGFTQKFQAFKEAMKKNEAEQAGVLSGELLKLLKEKFTQGSNYSRSPDSIRGFQVKYMTEHSGERQDDFNARWAVKAYISTIEHLSKPFIKAGFDGVVRNAEAEPDVKKAYKDMYAAGEAYKARMDAEDWDRRNAINVEVSSSIQRVVKPKITEAMAPLTTIKDVYKFVVEMFPDEMRSRRSDLIRYNENQIPGWAKPAIMTKINELRLLKETAMDEREERAQRGEIKIRFSPKREFDKWNANREGNPLTPDPEDRVISFVLSSSSYNDNEKLGFLTKMSTVHPIGESWLLSHTYSVAGQYIQNYMAKHHNRQWPELEAVWPKAVYEGWYITIAYKGKRIPAKETSLLSAVGLRSSLDAQLDYINDHMGGKRWPELETKIVQVFSLGDWKQNGYYSNKSPENLAESILNYCSRVIHGRWEAIEPKMFESDDYAFKYIFRILPDAKERLRRMMSEQQVQESVPGEKTSNKRILARLKTALFNQGKRS